MGDTEVTALPAPRVKRQYRRRMVAKPAVKAPGRHGGSVHDDAFDGLTLRSCANACNEKDGCVISGDICVHPMMSGCLQAAHKMKPPVMAKFDRAKQLLERQQLDVRQSRDREQPGRL
jgi:hypothetical protein